MKAKLNRRRFLRTSVAASLAAPLVGSLEEHALAAQEGQPSKAPTPAPAAVLPTGTIGKVRLSRLICGGNLISGYAHSRDLIYVSKLLQAYHSGPESSVPLGTEMNGSVRLGFVCIA